MNSNRRFATPTEEGMAVVGGPIAKGSPEERAAAVARIRREATSPEEAQEFLLMLGLAEPDFGWVPTGHNQRKRVPR